MQQTHPLRDAGQPAQWALLLGLSVAFAATFSAVRLPGSLLLGPMAAAIVMHTSGGRIVLPKLPVFGSQAIIGLLLARAITPTVVAEFGREWPLFGGVVLTTVGVSVALGWIATRLKLLEGTTAIWGLMPGAANLMMLMADALGADARIVAFMQYLRVVVVAVVASVVARFFVHVHGGAAPAIVWFPPPDIALAQTLVLAAIGAAAGYVSKLAGGVIIVPLILGGLLHVFGLVPIELPPWLLTLSYAFVGWNVGLRFTREVLGYALRTLPQVLTCILLLVACCGGVAYVLVKTLGVDVLTAYLATSPGGADSVAIIAASATAKVDVSFVMALQTVRFLGLVFAGPLLSRAALRWRRPR